MNRSTRTLPSSLDLEWKMIYVGSAESSEYDQVLDSIMVGPIPVGVNKFIFSVISQTIFETKETRN